MNAGETVVFEERAALARHLLRRRDSARRVEASQPGRRRHSRSPLFQVRV